MVHFTLALFETDTLDITACYKKMWPMRSDTDSNFRETQEASKQRIKAQK